MKEGADPFCILASSNPCCLTSFEIDTRMFTSKNKNCLDVYEDGCSEFGSDYI